METNGRPVVSWAGPLQSAEQALRAAEDFFERRRFADGIAQLGIAQRQMTLAVEFIVRTDLE